MSASQTTFSKAKMEVGTQSEKLVEDKSDKGRDFDDIYKSVASFGVLQAVLFFGSSLVILQVASGYALLLFAMGTPNFHCETPNVTCDPNQCCQNCTSYAFDGPFTSIVSEWNLLCDRSYLQAIVRSCFYAGDIIGSVCFGIFSDAYGRKRSMFLGLAILVSFVFGASFADCVSLLCFLCFCAGFGTAGALVSQYVYFMEIVGPKVRLAVTSVYEWYWCVGFVWLALLSFLIRDWRMLMMVSSFLGMAMLFTWKFVPETPRWLLAHGRVSEAHDFLVRCGSKSKEPLDQENLRALVKQIRKSQEKTEKVDKIYTVFDLVRTPKIRKWTIAVGINWFVTTILSHGMMLNLTSLSGDIYINVVIVQSITFLVYPFFWVIVQRFGRRLPHLLLMLITSVLCFLAAIIPSEYATAKTALFITAYCVSACLWVTICLFNSELFPTVLRNKAHGVCSMLGRSGAVLAPYVAMMANLPGVDKSTPVIIFAVFSFCGCIATIWIPETINKNMHQTIEEAEAAPEVYNNICCCKNASREAKNREMVELS